MKELFTEVWTRLKELRKAGEAQGNKFSGFCGVLSSLTIYTFYYYLWQVLGWGFTKIVPDQRGLPLPRLCLSPGKPTPIDKSPGMPRISLLIMTIKLLLKAIPALELMPLLPLQQKTTFLSVPSRFLLSLSQQVFLLKAHPSEVPPWKCSSQSPVPKKTDLRQLASQGLWGKRERKKWRWLEP